MSFSNPGQVVFLALLVLTFGSSKAQSDVQEKVDSLKSFLKENPSSIFIYYDIAEVYRFEDSLETISYAELGLKKAIENDNQFAIGKGNFLLGDVYADYGHPLKSENYFRKADTVLTELIKTDSAEAHLKLWVRANFNIGVVRSYRGINDDIYFLNKISRIAERIGYDEILAKANTNLAISFYNNEQYQKAFEYFQIGGPKHLKVSDMSSYTTNRLLFSSCLLEMDSLSRAKIELDGVQQILDSIPSVEKQQLYHTILGEYHFKEKDYRKAVFNYKKAEKYLKKGIIVNNDLQLYLDFMRAYGGMKDYVEASQYARECLKLADGLGNYVIQAEIHKDLSTYLLKMNKPNEAYSHLMDYVAISDSLNISELEKEINRLETSYQSERKEREILQLKSQNDIVELQLAKKQTQNYLLFSSSMGLLVLAGMAFLGYRNFRKRDQLKTAEINELRYQQESKVYNAMLEGQESERKRLAIDLHDGLAGRLSATRLKLEKLAKKDGKVQDKALNQAVVNIDTSLSELRSIAMNLMPETLFKYGLKNAVEDYCSSIGKDIKNLKFIVQFYEQEMDLSSNTSLTIYRIIQELITNAVKHSKATEVFVQYLEEGERINITVEDNGVGFDKESIAKKTGMGLNNLKTRVTYLNGDIDIISSREEGTTVHIVIDL
ncbi:MAG: sensor histidine kinase [Bacteroidota bacterium]